MICMINATAIFARLFVKNKSHKLIGLTNIKVCDHKIQSLIYTNLEYYVLANDSSIYVNIMILKFECIIFV